MTEVKELFDCTIGEECSKRGAIVLLLAKVYPRGVRFSAVVDWAMITLDAVLLGYQFTVLLDPPRRVGGWLRRQFERNIPKDHYSIRRFEFTWGEPRPVLRVTPEEYKAVEAMPNVRFGADRIRLVPHSDGEKG